MAIASYLLAPGQFSEHLDHAGADAVSAPIGVHPLLVEAIVDAINSDRLVAKIGVVISDNPAANALRRIAGLDIPMAVVERKKISMCGAAPMALALFAAHALGEPWAELCLYDTSATASGDTHRVVGYAGLRFGLA